ncbi:MAG: hypothetical protein EOO41_02565, partial [Methanobacteriota archaeon]
MTVAAQGAGCEDGDVRCDILPDDVITLHADAFITRAAHARHTQCSAAAACLFRQPLECALHLSWNRAEQASRADGLELKTDTWLPPDSCTQEEDDDLLERRVASSQVPVRILAAAAGSVCVTPTRVTLSVTEDAFGIAMFAAVLAADAQRDAADTTTLMERTLHPSIGHELCGQGMQTHLRCVACGNVRSRKCAHWTCAVAGTQPPFLPRSALALQLPVTAVIPLCDVQPSQLWRSRRLRAALMEQLVRVARVCTALSGSSGVAGGVCAPQFATEDALQLTFWRHTCRARASTLLATAPCDAWIEWLQSASPAVITAAFHSLSLCALRVLTVPAHTPLADLHAYTALLHDRLRQLCMGGRVPFVECSVEDAAICSLSAHDVDASNSGTAGGARATASSRIRSLPLPTEQCSAERTWTNAVVEEVLDNVCPAVYVVDVEPADAARRRSALQPNAPSSPLASSDVSAAVRSVDVLGNQGLRPGLASSLLRTLGLHSSSDAEASSSDEGGDSELSDREEEGEQAAVEAAQQTVGQASARAHVVPTVEQQSAVAGEGALDAPHRGDDDARASEQNAMLAQLEGMGFAREWCQLALSANGNSVASAVSWLLDNAATFAVLSPMLA